VSSIDGEKPVAVVTGASSGIGAATATKLAERGYEVVLGARRVDRLEDLARRCGGRAGSLDVTDSTSVARFADNVERVDVLVNNAGKALGMEPLTESSDEDIDEMWETNVMGMLSVTRALLDKLEQAGGHIVNVTSIAGFEVYPGGGGYTASKHAARAMTRTLRLELVGKPIRITEIAPGHVETEFAIVRFGDERKARDFYKGFRPLEPNDVADSIVWAVTRPPNVNVDEIVMRAIAQASATVIARSEED
jgi:NADP-dependent 3-hydroxy acid dehydrogenase YdfG